MSTSTEEESRIALLKSVLNSTALNNLLATDPHVEQELEQFSDNMSLDMLFWPTKDGKPGCSEKQLEVAEAFRKGKRFVAAGGANRSGKTRCIGGMCFCRQLVNKAKPGDIYWVIAQDAKTMRAVPQRLMAELLPRTCIPKNRTYTEARGFGDRDAMGVQLPSGGKCSVYFKTEEMGINKFESEQCTGIWWTEATREMVFDAVQPRLLDVGGFLIIDYLPTLAWQKYRIAKNEDFMFRRFCTLDNAHNLPTGAIDELSLIHI